MTLRWLMCRAERAPCGVDENSTDNGLYMCPGKCQCATKDKQEVWMQAQMARTSPGIRTHTQYLVVAITATRMFNVNAAGFIMAGDIPTSAIAAR